MTDQNPLDDILNSPTKTQEENLKSPRSGKSNLAGSLGKSVLMSIVRNVTGTITRAIMKSLLGSKKSGGSKSGRY